MAGWRDAPIVGGGWRDAPTVSQEAQPSTAEDVGRSALSGALQVGGSILDLPAMIGRLPMQLSDRFLGTDMLADVPAPTPFIESVGEVAPSVQAAAEYDPQTVLGGYAQQTGEFLPGLLTPGGLACSYRLRRSCPCHWQ
jgi:hypothetical protein